MTLGVRVDWKSLNTTFEEGLRVTGMLQQAWYSAYLAHVAAGRGYLFETAIFNWASAGDDKQVFYFTPETVQLLGSLLDRLGAQPCNAPPRRRPDAEFFEGLSMLAGDARAWKLVKDA